MEYTESTNTLVINDVFSGGSTPIVPGECILVIKGVKVQSYTDYSPKPTI